MSEAARDLETYLAALRRALGGAPPGLIADAPADADLTNITVARNWIGRSHHQSGAACLRPKMGHLHRHEPAPGTAQL